jgi:hypothetical protein
MNTEISVGTKGATVDIRPLKEKLRKKLPPTSLVLVDLVDEPDFMPISRAEILVPHYLRRLEKELEKADTGTTLVLRA